MPKTTTPARPDSERVDLLDLVIRLGNNVLAHYRLCNETSDLDCEALASLVTEARLMADRIVTR